MLKKYITKMVDTLPEELEEGVIYYSDRQQRSVHLCPCNCKDEVWLSHYRGGWKHFIDKNEEITISTLIENHKCDTYYTIQQGFAFGRD